MADMVLEDRASSSSTAAQPTKVPFIVEGGRKTLQKAKGKGKADDEEGSDDEDAYEVEHRGKVLNSDEARKQRYAAKDLPTLSRARLEVDDAVNKTLDAITFGYVGCDLIDPTQAFHVGYLNGRAVNEREATRLMELMILNGCKKNEYPLIVAVDTPDAFTTIDGHPAEYAKTPASATPVRKKENVKVWLISGSHRWRSVVLGYQMQQKVVEVSDEWLRALLRSNAKSTKQGKRDIEASEQELKTAEENLRSVDTVWRTWPARVVDKRQLDKNDTVMAAVKVRLAANVREHQYEATPREALQMALHDPHTPEAWLNQQTKRLFRAPGFRPLLVAWTPFKYIGEPESLQIGTNDKRIHEPWLGIWTTFMAHTLDLTRDLVKPPEDDDFVSSVYISTVNPTFLGYFDQSFTQFLLPVLESGHLCDKAGNATPNWINAYLEYCANLQKSLLTYFKSPVVPSQVPQEEWSRHHKAATGQIVVKIATRLAEIENVHKSGQPIALAKVFPWFCDEAAKVFVRIAEQASPAMSQIAELLEPCWRHFRPGALSPGDKANTTAWNRRPYDLPDDATLVRFHASLQSVSSAADADWFRFVVRFVFSGTATLVSARTVEYNLRTHTGQEPSPSPVGYQRYEPPTQPRKVKAYLRGRLASVATGPLRKELPPDKAANWETWQKTDPAIRKHIDPGFLNYIDTLVSENSYFPRIAPLITNDLDAHVHNFHSLFCYNNTSLSAFVTSYLQTVEFQDFWNMWCQIGVNSRLAERQYYHAVPIPEEARVGTSQFKPHHFALCFDGPTYPTTLAAGEAGDKKAEASEGAKTSDAAPRTKRPKSAKPAVVEDPPETEDETDEEAEAPAKPGKGSAKGRGGGSRSGGGGGGGKRKRSPDPDAAAVGPPASRRKAESQEGKPLVKTDSTIEDSDVEENAEGFMQSNNPLEQAYGVFIKMVQTELKLIGFDVVRMEREFSNCLGAFALNGLPADLVAHCSGLRWTVLAALALHGRSTHAFWLPPTPQAFSDAGEAAMSAFNKAAALYRFAPHDPVLSVEGINKSSVGYLAINVPTLHRLRQVTQTVFKQWETTDELPNLVAVTKALVPALIADWTQQVQRNPPVVAKPVDEDMKSGE
ncbi:hypothetical protein FRC00_012700 [Tulasnella sp. 408]|nr:hypothetical protein FRC00_012700 [Tulasnella sp. 408]